MSRLSCSRSSCLRSPALAKVPAPLGFRTQDIATNGATIHVRIGGTGPAVVLLHGYGETGDMWAPLAAELARDHTVIVPDLRGMGLSSHPAGGYDKKTQADDIARRARRARRRARSTSSRTTSATWSALPSPPSIPSASRASSLIDAPLPGVGPWDEILKNPLLWHFRFGGPDMERLVAGRERIYLDRFWNEFSADPSRFNEASREHYAALYALPGAMHSGFAQFAAFDQDAIDNQAFLAKGKLTMPVLAIGGEKSFGPTMADRHALRRDDVHRNGDRRLGHWLMEEQPAATVAAVRAFLDPK